MKIIKKTRERILSLVLVMAMMVSLLVGITPEEVHASNDSMYEPLILNSSTLNASTVWAEGDESFLMDGDGGFFSSDKQSNGAFPDDGAIVTSDGVPYQLSWEGNTPYAGNDSIRFVGQSSGGYVTSDAVTMKINTFGVYDKVYVLGTAGGFADNSKSLNFKVTLTYADGSSTTTTYSLYDWYKPVSYVQSYGIGYKVFQRLNKDGTSVDPDYGTNGGPMVQSKQIECDETKVLKDITFEIADTPSYVANKYGIYAAIYAVTGMLKDGAPGRPAASVQEVSANSVTLEWGAVDGAASYAVDVSEHSTFQDENGDPSFVSGYLNKAVNGTSIVVEGLDKDVTYYCRVRAVGSDGAQGRSSATVSATTKEVASDDPEPSEGVNYEFNYAYDCQRSPAYPVVGDSVTLHSFVKPVGANESAGEWELIDCGKYDSSKFSENKGESLANVVSKLAGKYNTTISDINVYDLKKDGVHICYGVVATIFEDGVLFIGTTWSGGAGYYLCNTELSSSSSITEEAIGDANTPAPVKPEVTYPLGTIENLGDDSITIDSDNVVHFAIPEDKGDYLYINTVVPVSSLGDMTAEEYIALIQKGIGKSVVDVLGTLDIDEVEYNKQLQMDDMTIFITNSDAQYTSDTWYYPIEEESVAYMFKFHKDNLISATYRDANSNPYLQGLASNVNIFAVYGVHAEVVTPTGVAEKYTITLDSTNLQDEWVSLYGYTDEGDYVDSIYDNGESIRIKESGYVRVFAGVPFTVTAEGATISDMMDASEEGYYYEITNFAGDTTVVVNPLSLPQIVNHPQDASVKEGEKATFSVTATGEGLSYQWEIDRNDGEGFVEIEGAKSANYTTSVVDMDCDGFVYRCIVSNKAGSVTSTTATLTVNEKTHVHSLTLEPEKPATCTEDGCKAYYKCSGCDTLYADAEGTVATTLEALKIGALGHDMSDATCEEASKCQRTGCDHTEGKALGHDMKAATCEEASKCQRTGCTHTQGKALGHDMKAATCEEASKCQRTGCTHTQGKALGHDMSKATCTEASKCQRTGCNHTEGEALGHDMSKATCTEASKCQRTGCDHTEGKVLGHDWSGEWKVIREATATEEGKKETYCVRGCGQKKVANIPKVGEEDENENLEKDAEVEPGAPIDEVTLDNSKEEILNAKGIFTEKEKELIENGVFARVWLEVTKTNESEISADDKAEMEQAAEKIMGENPVITYFDAELFKQVGEDKTSVSEPGVAMKITIVIPEELRCTDKEKVREYTLLHLHNGKVETITGKYNAQTGEFSFKTEKFSTFAIVYKDLAKDDVPKTGETSTAPYAFTLMMVSGLGLLFSKKKREEM